MKHTVVKVVILAITFIVSTSVVVVIVADSVMKLFPHASVHQQGQIFAYSVVPLYFLVGISSTYFMNKHLNKKRN